MIFWGLKPGNSASPQLARFSAVGAGRDVELFQLCGEKTRKVWILLCVLTLVATLDTTGNNSVNPNIDLLLASTQVEGSSNSLHPPSA